VTPPPNAATAAARTVVDELVRCGVQHVVLSPGSRSAPLAFAAYDAAAAERLTLHTRLDERTAGFLALGLARTSRRPVAVVTTSGTAVANLHPAVLEASHAGLPLVLLTADRPAHLRGTGANQTTWQPGMFGRAVREEVDVPPGAPGQREAEQVVAWRSTVARLVHSATRARPGPVHLNLQLDGTLTPDASDGWATGLAGRPHGRWTEHDDETLPSWASLSGHERTVVVAGDDAGPPARVLAEAAGWPLLAEPSSGSRTGDNAIRTYRLLLGDEDLAGRVEQVVLAGHPTLSRPVTRLLSRTDLEVVALADRHGHWSDPGHGVSRVVSAALPEGMEPPQWSATRPADPGQSDKNSPWLAEWKDRDAALGQRLDALLDTWDAPLVPHHVAGEVASALPPGGLLFVGSSNPVRDLDLMVPRYDVGARRMVVANRGLAGIDGSLSSAIGCALGRPRSTRSLALLGDVTFLHDLTGLAIGPIEARPDLTVVVVNDDGGSIFALLEQGAEEHAASFERLFATPHGADLSALCRGLGVPHRQVRDREALREALATPTGGLEVVEAVVRRDDRRALDAAVRALVREV
jgi:2-succinyl-5-enolpyruvyl-6-hydroxy-3-cyclohexene-1-carboxylate synthase